MQYTQKNHWVIHNKARFLLFMAVVIALVVAVTGFVLFNVWHVGDLPLQMSLGHSAMWS